jgi:hypothetical protein
MFNKKIINILLKIIGWVTIVGAVIFVISGFFMVPADIGTAAESAGYVFGYEVVGMAMIAFFYVILGVLFRVNNAKN